MGQSAPDAVESLMERGVEHLLRIATRAENQASRQWLVEATAVLARAPRPMKMGTAASPW